MAVYLDNAATSFPKPECVYHAVDDYLRHNGAAYGRGTSGSGNRTGQIVSQCRHRLAAIIGAESDDRVALTFNCTDSLNLVLFGLLKTGDHVLTTTLEHNSVLRPLEQLKADLGIEVTYVDFDSATGIINVEDLRSQLAERPVRLLVVNHASNVTGAIQPLDAISRAAQAAGTLLLVDAAQTLGHVPLSVRELGIDFLCAAGHKGLLGPLGTGLLYVRTGHEQHLRPTRCGGTGTVSESLQQPLSMPTLFESGNLNMPGIAGLNSAAGWVLDQGIDQLQRHMRKQLTELSDGLRTIDGVTVFSPASQHNAGIVSFVIDGMDCQEAATILDQSFDIQCRAGLHCAPLVHRQLGTSEGGTLRFSPGWSTTDEDIRQAVDAIHQIAAVTAK